VKALIAGKVVKNDLLGLGVVSFDGKGTWSRADGEKVEGARQSSYDADGSSLQTFGALRATLSSSSVCPCVGQRTIGSKEGEATAFRELLPRICEELGGQFKIVTGDAGLCARENAELATRLGRWYLFGLKANQPYLYDLARDCRGYSIGKPLARTAERYRGQTIVRELFARSVAGEPAADIEGAQQVWYVCQATYDSRGTCTAVEQRHFVTSIPAGTLTREQELALVRMHWAIENGCHWTMDVMLGEDDAQPCQATRASLETVSWLRVIGYNLVSAWRQQAPRKDRRPIAWQRAMETLRDALLLAPVIDRCQAVPAVT
jgi:predicted transposase YbfD/YdcC